MERKLEFCEGEYYHVFQRGHNKNAIFLGDKDYWRLMISLYTSNSTKGIQLSDYPSLEASKLFALERGETLVDIGAYCLMPNHFHLLIREKRKGGISSFMQKLTTSHSMYFNKKYGQTGSPLEKPFRAKHVDSDEYLNYLFAYIHLNPVKVFDPEGWGSKRIKNPSQAKSFLDNYRYSSYQFYSGKILYEDKILNKEAFPDYFTEPKDFNSYLADWLANDEAESCQGVTLT